MIDIRPTHLPGCFEIWPAVHRDGRGVLAKPFQTTAFQDVGIATDWRELFYSASTKDVVRGLHFQLPPAEHAKLVSCVYGQVFDVVVDLRVGSPTFGQFKTFSLSGADMSSVFVPTGFAHGFAATSDEAILAYAVTSEHDAACDTGVRWDSVPGLQWPTRSPSVSERDSTLPALRDFVSPFVFEPSLA